MFSLVVKLRTVDQCIAMQEPKLAGGWADGKWYDVPMAFNLAVPMCEAPKADEV